MAFIIQEQYSSTLRIGKNQRGHEIGYTAWQDNGSGVLVPSTPMQIETAIGIGYGDLHPTMSALICTGYDVRRRDRSEVFDASYQYEIPDPEDKPDDFAEFMQRSQQDDLTNPLRPKRSGGGMTIEEYSWEDLDQKRWLNSSDQPFKDLQPNYVTVQVKRVTWASSSAVNTGNQGMCQGRRMLASLSYDEQEHQDRSTGATRGYYQNTAEVWEHPFRDWAYVTVWDLGTMQKSVSPLTGAIRYAIIRDPDTKEPVTEPVALDGNGAFVPPPGRPAPIRFRTRPVGSLNLPFNP